MSAATTYAPDRIGYRYGTPDSAYSKGYHRGQDVRKLNETGTASVVTDVEAIDDGTVVYVGRPNGLLAWTVVIDTGRAKGRYESHSHMADISVGVGQRVSSGDRLGRNASMGEDRGFIDGSHDHVTITDRFDGAWVTWLDEYDPLPFMQAAYARATITTQGDNDLPPKEDDMTQSVTVDNKHQFAVGEEFISHYATGSQSDVTRKVTSAGDEMHQLNGPQFLDLCDGLGIPRDVVRLTDGYVLNPQSGVYERGGVWSRRREGVAVAQRNMGLTQSILDKLTGK